MRQNAVKEASERGMLRKIGRIVLICLSGFFLLLSFSLRWMMKTWNGLTMDELMYHMNTDLEGTSTDMIREYIVLNLIPTLILAAVICVILYMLKNARKQLLFVLVCLIISGSTAGVMLRRAWVRLDVSAYLKNQGEYSTFIDDNYVDPATVEITFPEEKKNLIYIYLESMEVTYADEENDGAFEENCIPELTQLAETYEDFSGTSPTLNGSYVMPGSTWTVAAMFGQVSGLPLKVTYMLEDSEIDMNSQDSFFADAVLLGDILQDAGYQQTLMIGSDAVFGGRRMLFSDHGDYEICDYNWAVDTDKIDEDYYVWWGYEDEKLIEYAKEKLLELSAEEEPFNFTMLTVDTHFEDGYVCDLCPDIFGDNQYANVMACSSEQISAFVAWIQEQDFYEDTVIVLSGDHLTMDSDFCEDVDETEYDRKVYTAYINAAAVPETDGERVYTMYDNFPTTLAALGASIEGNRLGLGTNLFSAEPTLTETYGVDAMSDELEKNSLLMEALGDFENFDLWLKAKTGRLEEFDVETWRDNENVYIQMSNVPDLASENLWISVEIWPNDNKDEAQTINAMLIDEANGTYKAWMDLNGSALNAEDFHYDIYVANNNGVRCLVQTIETE